MQSTSQASPKIKKNRFSVCLDKGSPFGRRLAITAISYKLLCISFYPVSKVEGGSDLFCHYDDFGET